MTFLASRSCELSHHYISAVAGRYARTFIGLGPGWLADRDIEVQAEDIAEHLAEITGTDGGSVPMSVADEIVAVLGQLDLI